MSALYLIGRTIYETRFAKPVKKEKHEDPEIPLYEPARAQARILLDEVDRLAAEGKFINIAQHICRDEISHYHACSAMGHCGQTPSRAANMKTRHWNQADIPITPLVPIWGWVIAKSLIGRCRRSMG